MATEKQKAANKENAQHSTGPTSEAGSIQAALNNYRHGLATYTHEHFGYMSDENPEKFAELLNQLCHEHIPTGETEYILVRHMAESEWLRGRALRFQAECMIHGFKSVETAKLALFIRYETTHQRAFYKALNELQNLRKQKQNSEIGFESQNLKKAAESRASEALNLKKEEFLLKKETVQWRMQAQKGQNSPSPTVAPAGIDPDVSAGGQQMAA
jgi:hypothetical protein